MTISELITRHLEVHCGRASSCSCSLVMPGLLPSMIPLSSDDFSELLRRNVCAVSFCKTHDRRYFC